MIVPSVHEEHVGQKTWRSDACLPLYCEKPPHIFLTALPSYDAVAIHLGPCEKHLHYKKLATSSYLKRATGSFGAVAPHILS
jgi:hypothetical protein